MEPVAKRASRRDRGDAWIPFDTAPDADEAQFAAYRRLGPAGRLAAAFSLSATTRRLTAAGIRRRHPRYSDEDVELALAHLLFGDARSRGVAGPPAARAITPEEETLREAILVLQRAGVPYMLTGSVAASYYGRPRSTHDSDIVIAPTPAQLDAVVDALIAAGFYVDAAGARRALARRSQFNVIHTTYACKIDLIVCKDREFSRGELERRCTADLSFG